IVFTVRSAFPATSEFGTPTPNVFSILTTSSNASIESKPSPSGPKSGSSSPICSEVTWSIRFLTSISFIWARKSDSDINERGFCRNLRVRSNVQNVRTSHFGQSAARTHHTPKHFVRNPRGMLLLFHVSFWSAYASSRRFRKARLDRLYRRESLRHSVAAR